MTPTFHSLLETFRSNHQPSVLKSEKEKKAFYQLQKYNLVRLNSEGRIVITGQGEEAIVTGVEQYIKNLRFEQKLAKEAPKLKREKKILYFLIFLLLLSLLAVIFFDANEALLTLV